jgi:hypothetical protein
MIARVKRLEAVPKKATPDGDSNSWLAFEPLASLFNLEDRPAMTRFLYKSRAMYLPRMAVSVVADPNI